VTSFIRQLRLLLLGLWLGAAMFFGAAVAPALFGVLRGAGLMNANELAGSVVTRLLAFINRGGIEIGLFLLVTAFFVNRHRSRLAQVVEMISVAIMAIMTGVSHWIISAKMQALRAAMGIVDQVSPADARRVEFDALHRYSVMIMSVALVAGLVAFVIASRDNARSR
jgi:prepilin signal peptidase PulO-like enzyme (type II secretory pathway)